MDRKAFVDTARSYLGTPFHHQGRLPGVGIDCAGVVVCAAREHGYHVDDVHGYAHTPGQGIFTAAMMAHCDLIQINEVLPGDLMFFAFDSEPQHVAIISDKSADGTITLLHAYSQVRKVVENHLDDMWRARLRGCFRLKGIV